MRPKGNAAKLEARRRKAAKMLSKGQGIREVARRVGAAPSSVKRWKDAVESGGTDALKSKPHTGRPPYKLSPRTKIIKKRKPGALYRQTSRFPESPRPRHSERAAHSVGTHRTPPEPSSPPR